MQSIEHYTTWPLDSSPGVGGFCKLLSIFNVDGHLLEERHDLNVLSCHPHRYTTEDNSVSPTTHRTSLPNSVPTTQKEPGPR